MREGRALSPGQAALLALVLAYLGLILLLPLGAMALRALEAGPAMLLAIFSDEAAMEGLGLTLVLALIALAANGLFGVGAGLVLVRHRFLGRKLLDALVDLPLAVSPVMTGLAFLLVFGRGGWLEPWLEVAGLKVSFAFPGLVLATLFVTFPFTLREVAYVLIELGTDEEEAAVTLGASRLTLLTRVLLPPLAPAIAAGAIQTFARAVAEFGSIAAVSGNVPGRTLVAPVYVLGEVEGGDVPAAAAVSVALLTLSLALHPAARRLGGVQRA